MTSHPALARRLIDAVAAGDRPALAATLAATVRLRALLPGRSVDMTGRDEVAAEMLGWFAEVPEVRVDGAEVEEFGGLLRIGYRFGLRGAGAPEIVDQQAYLTEAGGEVTTVRLICSGFRPAPPAGTAPEPAPAPARHLDALGQGCATLTPLIGSTLRGMAAGEVLAVLADDPAAAEGIASWSRLTGHPVVATEPGAGGTRYYLRHA
jgi:TusA-related sulfurtransferase